MWDSCSMNSCAAKCTYYILKYLMLSYQQTFLPRPCPTTWNASILFFFLIFSALNHFNPIPYSKIQIKTLNFSWPKLPDGFRRKGFYYLFIYLFIYFWLRWVFVAVCGLSLVAASGGYSSLQCMGFSLWWLLLLRSTALGTQASVVVSHGLSSCGSRALGCRLSSCGMWA